MSRLIIPILAATVAACGPAQSVATEAPEAPEAAIAAAKNAPATAVEAAKPAVDSAKLTSVLAAQEAKHQARHIYRHPKETIEFFGIAPGMTVVEAVPGGGWYSKILMSYLGAEGKLVGINYAYDMWAKFGFFTPEQVEEQFREWTTKWPEEAKTWTTDAHADVAAFEFGTVPAEMEASADVVLFIRALHNLRRFENDGGYLTAALADAYKILKPGGIVGVVQHQAPDAMSDEWADGSRGYVKKARVIATMEAAGFEYIADSNINENPKDQPGEEDFVWRLPPSFATSRENPEMKPQMAAIGESNRMTLKFRKPAQ